jgi:hypothetical protein
MTDGQHTDSKMPLRCGDCGNEWIKYFKLPMDINEFTHQLNVTVPHD